MFRFYEVFLCTSLRTSLCTSFSAFSPNLDTYFFFCISLYTFWPRKIVLISRQVLNLPLKLYEMLLFPKLELSKQFFPINSAKKIKESLSFNMTP